MPITAQNRRSLSKLSWPFILAGLALIGIVALSIYVGSRDLDAATVWNALRSRGNPEENAIILDQRVPRTILGVLGGAALAVAGTLIQGHTRNPLSDPGLLGVTSGASLAVVLAMTLFGLTTPAGHLWFALLGAAGTTLLVTTLGTLASRRRESSAAALVLAGAAVSAALGAITSVLLLLDTTALDSFRFWTVGSLSGGRPGALSPLVLGLLAGGAVLALIQVRTLDTLALGDDMAKSLGTRLVRARIIGLAAVTLLTGGATVLVGSLGFVGLAAPHIARSIVGHAHALVIPLAALLGATMVLAADIIGRVVVSPAELPVGVVLGVVGGSVFLGIVIHLFRRRKA